MSQRWWLFVCAFVALSRVSSIVIRDKGVQTFRRASQLNGNETTWERYVLNAQCRDTDARGVNIQIGDLFYDIECPSPIVRYTTRLVGFVPREQRIMTSEDCLVDNLSRFNASDDDESIKTFPQLSPNRRLLWSWDNAIQGSKQMFVVPRGFVCMTGAYDDYFCDGGGGDVSDARIATLLAQSEMFRDLKNVTATLTADILQMQITNDRRDAELSTLFAGFETTTKFLQTLNNSLGVLTQFVSEEAAATQAAFQDVYINVGELISEVYGDLTLEVKALATAVQTNQETIVNATIDMNDQTREDFELVMTLIKQVQQQLRKLAANELEAKLKRQIRYRKISNVQKMVAGAAEKGLVPFLHPAFSGRFPTATAADQQDVVFDQLDFDFVNESVAQEAHQVRVSLHCQADEIIKHRLYKPDYRDLIEMIGPVGCAAQTGGPTVNCRCHVTVSHYECQPNAGFSWNKEREEADDNFDMDLNAAKCRNAAPTASDWNGNYIDSIPVFHDLLGDLCAVTHAAPADGSGIHQMVMHSRRLGVIVNVTTPDPSVKDELCHVDLSRVMELPKFRTGNIIYNTYTFLVHGFLVLISNGLAWEDTQHGRLPDFVTHSTREFQMLDDGRPYTCYRTTLLAVSPDTIPVYQITDMHTEATVISTAYATAMDCTGSECVATSDPVAVERTATVTPTLPDQSSILQIGDIVFGDIKPVGMASIRDPERGLCPLTSDVGPRENTYCYLLQPVPASYNILTSPNPPTELVDAFIARNVFEPNHLAGGLTVADMVVPLVDGRPFSDSNRGFNVLATTFAKARVHSSTNMKKGILAFNIDQFAQEVQLQVVQGEVIQRVEVGCPEISVKSYTNGLGVITFYNSLPQQIVFVLRVERENCGTTGDIRYTLAPKVESAPYILERCGRQTAFVTQIGVNNKQTLCASGALNVTVDPLGPAALDPTGVIELNRTFVTDVVTQSSIDLLNEFTDLLRQIVPITLPTFNPQLTDVQRSIIINNTINDFIQQFIDKGKAVVIPQDVVSRLAPFIDEMNRLNRTLAEQADQFRQIEYNKTLSLQIEARLSAQLVEANSRFQNSTDKALDAMAAEIEAIRKAKRGGDDGCLVCTSGGFLCNLICPLWNAMITIAIVALVALIGWAIFKCLANRIANSGSKSTSGRYQHPRRVDID